MIITEVIGNLRDIVQSGRKIDYLELEWFETSKRILHKESGLGRTIRLKLLRQTQSLTDGDVLYQDNETLVVVQLRPCESIVIRPGSMYGMAYICYEIGNKHLPLFYENDELLIPYEAPLLRVLQASGFKPLIEVRKLVHQIRTTVSPHGHADGKSLFSKILHLTSSNG